MKPIRILLLFVVFLPVSLGLHSFYPSGINPDKEQELITAANLYSLRFPNEKIYLHLDRPSYWSGENIWFKAYLLNTAIPDCNLYVELVNLSGEVVDKKICWALHGLAYGDFHLPDSIPGGIYQVRAYTNWMRNFDEQWFFRRNVIISHIRDKIPEKEIFDLKARDVDLQFFPEGGTFVANVRNKVAFRAVDKNGKGISVKGEITDEKGKKAADFKSGFKGIGSFEIIPETGKKYIANAVIGSDIEIKVNLPVAVTNEIKLEIDPFETDSIHLQILDGNSPSASNSVTEFLILGQSGGQICFHKQVSLSGQQVNLNISKNSLPSGIIKFTVFDNNLIPHCERLVFLNHHQNINLEITSGKPEYLPREKVELQIKALTKDGIPCLSNLSMSVYNPELQLGAEQYPDNILTRFLLSSELKGTIEEPAWYLKDDSLSTIVALDNLMLSHGYRYFEWKEIMANQVPGIEYQPEESIQLRGKVTNWFSGKPVKNSNVTLMFVKSQLAVHQQTTDSIGNFVFSNLFFYDTVYASLQAGTDRQKKKNTIEIDDRSSVSPEPGYLPLNYRYNDGIQFKTSWYLSETDSSLIDRKWHLNDTILLGDINVLAINRKPKDDVFAKPYLKADYTFEVSKRDDIYSNIYEMLESTSAYMRNFLLLNPEYFLDGVRVDSDFVSGFPSNWFENVEAVRMANVSNGFGPGLFFYTKRGETQRKLYDKMGMKSTRIIGYSVIRRFYSPVYEPGQPTVLEDDFRNTIYWNPVVLTDSTGVAKVAYYGSDEPGKMQVVVEGITADGKLCRGLYHYEVKK